MFWLARRTSSLLLLAMGNTMRDKRGIIDYDGSSPIVSFFSEL